MADEVIEELWRIKDDMAREYGYDVARLAADLQGRQGKEGHRIVDLQALRGGCRTKGVGERSSIEETNRHSVREEGADVHEMGRPNPN